MATIDDASVRLEPVTGRRGLDRFIRLPNRLYAGSPNYVPPLLMERRQSLDVARNAYFRHARGRYWLAYRGDRPVGRISAQVDDLYLERHRDATGHFGLLDAEDDPEVFRTLTGAAEGWLRGQGVQRVVGPFNLSINEESGLLVDGFDAPAMVMMGFNEPYAAVRLGEQGYRKAKDLFAYDYDLGAAPPVRAERLLERTGVAGRVVVRHVDMARYRAEIAAIVDIFNDAWAENWGFVPFTEAEVKQVADAMRPLIRPELIWIAEVDGEPACMVVSLPNLYEAIADLGGRLLPLGWAKLLWRLRVSGVRTCRVPLMGLRRTHHRTLLGSALVLLVLQSLRLSMLRLGFERAELSWILEDNLPMRGLIEGIGGRVYKTYRLYEKPLV